MVQLRRRLKLIQIPCVYKQKNGQKHGRDILDKAFRKHSYNDQIPFKKIHKQLKKKALMNQLKIINRVFLLPLSQFKPSHLFCLDLRINNQIFSYNIFTIIMSDSQLQYSLNFRNIAYQQIESTMATIRKEVQTNEEFDISGQLHEYSEIEIFLQRAWKPDISSLERLTQFIDDYFHSQKITDPFKLVDTLEEEIQSLLQVTKNRIYQFNIQRQLLLDELKRKQINYKKNLERRKHLESKKAILYLQLRLTLLLYKFHKTKQSKIWEFENSMRNISNDFDAQFERREILIINRRNQNEQLFQQKNQFIRQQRTKNIKQYKQKEKRLRLRFSQQGRQNEKDYQQKIEKLRLQKKYIEQDYQLQREQLRQQRKQIEQNYQLQKERLRQQRKQKEEKYQSQKIKKQKCYKFLSQQMVKDKSLSKLFSLKTQISEENHLNYQKIEIFLQKTCLPGILNLKKLTQMINDSFHKNPQEFISSAKKKIGKFYQIKLGEIKNIIDKKIKILLKLRQVTLTNQYDQIVYQSRRIESIENQQQKLEKQLLRIIKNLQKIDTLQQKILDLQFQQRNKGKSIKKSKSKNIFARKQKGGSLKKRQI